MQTEVHVYAFSVSAGLLLSFFPFMTLILSLCRYVFKWKAAVNAIYFALNDYFPDAFGQFLRRNLEATVESRGPVQIISLVLLLFTANAIFEPLEVALNRVWKCPGEPQLLQESVSEPGTDLCVRRPDAAVDHPDRAEQRLPASHLAQAVRPDGRDHVGPLL